MIRLAKPDRGGRAGPKPPVKVADPFAAQVRSAVNYKYRPVQQQITGQIRASDQAQTNDAAWYQNYLREFDQARQATAQGYQTATDAISAQAATAAQTDLTNRQRMLAELQSSAAQRGATVNPTVNDTGAQAEAARGAGLANALAGTARTGADQNAYLADRGRIAGEAEVGAHQAEAGRRRSLVQKRVDTTAESRDYGNQVRQSLSAAAANQAATAAALGLKSATLKNTIKQQGVQNNLAQQRLGLDISKLNLSAQHQQALERIAQQNANTSSGNARARRQQNDYLRQHGLGPFKPPAATKPPREQQSSTNVKAAIISVEEQYGNLLQKNGGDHARTAQQIRSQAAAQKKNLPPYILQAAADLVSFGYVKPARIQQLEAIGVQVPRSWRHRDPSKVVHVSGRVGQVPGIGLP